MTLNKKQIFLTMETWKMIYIINTIFFFFNTIQDGVLLELGLNRPQVTCNTVFSTWLVGQKILTVTKGRWQGECFKQYTQYRLKYDNLEKKKCRKSSQSPEILCFFSHIIMCPSVPVVFVKLSNPAGEPRMEKMRRERTQMGFILSKTC